MLLVLKYLKNQMFYTYRNAALRVAKPRSGYRTVCGWTQCPKMYQCTSWWPTQRKQELLWLSSHQTVVAGALLTTTVWCADKPNYIKCYYRYEISILFLFFIYSNFSSRQSKRKKLIVALWLFNFQPFFKLVLVMRIACLNSNDR